MNAADALSSRAAVAIGRLAMVAGGSPMEWGRPAGPASAGAGRRKVVDRPLRRGRLGGDPLAGPDERAAERAAKAPPLGARRTHQASPVRFGVEPCKTVGVDRLQDLDLRVHRVQLPVFVGGVDGACLLYTSD